MRNRHKTATSRRGLIKGFGVVILTAQCLPLNARASDPSPCENKSVGGDLTIRSTPGFAFHTHDLLIPRAILKSPPRPGVSLTSTKALGHTHTLILSQAQLSTVNHGGTVRIRGGSHTFVITMTQAVGDKTAAVDSTRTQG